LQRGSRSARCDAKRSRKTKQPSPRGGNSLSSDCTLRKKKTWAKKKREVGYSRWGIKKEGKGKKEREEEESRKKYE